MVRVSRLRVLRRIIRPTKRNKKARNDNPIAAGLSKFRYWVENKEIRTTTRPSKINAAISKKMIAFQ